jgi:hypothetical protein
MECHDEGGNDSYRAVSRPEHVPVGLVKRRADRSGGIELPAHPRMPPEPLDDSPEARNWTTARREYREAAGMPEKAAIGCWIHDTEWYLSRRSAARRGVPFDRPCPT